MKRSYAWTTAIAVLAVFLPPRTLLAVSSTPAPPVFIQSISNEAECSGSANPCSVTVPYADYGPPTPLPGDLIIAFITAGGSYTSNPPLTGWSYLGSRIVATGTDACTQTGWVAAHIVGASETGFYTFTIPEMGASCAEGPPEFTVALFQYSSVDTNLSDYAALLDASAGDTTGDIETTSITAPANSKVLAIFAGTGADYNTPAPYDDCDAPGGSSWFCVFSGLTGSPALTFEGANPLAWAFAAADVWMPSGGITGPYDVKQYYNDPPSDNDVPIDGANLSAIVTIPAATNNPPPDGGACFGPVECSTGLLLQSQTDFFLPDTIPISFTRTYRTHNLTAGSFGNGQTDNYELYVKQTPGSTAILVLPDAAQVPYQLYAQPPDGYDYNTSANKDIFTGSKLLI